MLPFPQSALTLQYLIVDMWKGQPLHRYLLDAEHYGVSVDSFLLQATDFCFSPFLDHGFASVSVSASPDIQGWADAIEHALNG
mmetsp:Transcript_35152/g.51532  ORF Transcript_35152/g.51532 Transcript_35152/m.51532 type:complete len:83 (-) Transcript_35152:91-339(-)